MAYYTEADMKLAICDDEQVCRNEIADMINTYRLQKNLDIFPDIFDSGQKLLQSGLDYDVILIDYRMKNINGIATCRKIREINKDCAIIFISAYPTAALDSFEVGTFRFLAKPLQRDKLYKALDDYLRSVDNDSFLVLNTHEGKWKIKHSEIIYAEANSKHTYVRTRTKTYDICLHLKAIEAMLPEEKFIRCHKAYVVGFYHISNHTSDEILFDNGERAKLGRSYLARFRTAFQSYVLKYNRGEM